jgi:hypothetical protein
MKLEQQRIEIAKACGWKEIQDPIMFSYLMTTPAGIAPEETERLFSTIPDYLNDLNAMHEAWSILINGPKIGKEVSNDKIALRQLAMVVDPRHAPDWPDCDSYPIRTVLAIANATAIQISEAFLKTLKLWKEQSE